MSVKLYMDVHVKRAVTDALRLRGVDVLTAREDDSAELEDDLLYTNQKVVCEKSNAETRYARKCVCSPLRA